MNYAVSTAGFRDTQELFLRARIDCGQALAGTGAAISMVVDAMDDINTSLPSLRAGSDFPTVCLSLSALGRRSRLPGRGPCGRVLDMSSLTDLLTFGSAQAVPESIPRDGELHLGPPRMKPGFTPDVLRDAGGLGSPQLELPTLSRRVSLLFRAHRTLLTRDPVKFPCHGSAAQGRGGQTPGLGVVSLIRDSTTPWFYSRLFLVP